MVQRRAARFVVRNYNRTASVGVILDQLFSNYFFVIQNTADTQGGAQQQRLLSN